MDAEGRVRDVEEWTGGGRRIGREEVAALEGVVRRLGVVEDEDGNGEEGTAESEMR
jgi:hypothetical protein